MAPSLPATPYTARHLTTGSLRRALRWPRPAALVLTAVASSLIIGGAVGVGAAQEAPGPTPGPAAVAHSPLPTPATTAPTPPPSPAAPLVPAVPVLGAAPTAPIQALFASAAVEPGDVLLRDVGAAASPLVLVNKQHALQPADYAPAQLVVPATRSGNTETILLRPEAAAALDAMTADAAAQGVAITLLSGYRPHALQASLYEGYIAAQGQELSDVSSARPGHSEHQTGLALDIGDASVSAACEFTSCFTTSPAARWVAAHGANYGFIVRYPEGGDAVTGYAGEPWHLRYLGVTVAQHLRDSGVGSYEDYLGLPGSPSY